MGEPRRLRTKAGSDLYGALIAMTGDRDAQAYFEQVAAIEAAASQPALSVETLAAALWQVFGMDWPMEPVLPSHPHIGHHVYPYRLFAERLLAALSEQPGE